MLSFTFVSSGYTSKSKSFDLTPPNSYCDKLGNYDQASITTLGRGPGPQSKRQKR